MTLAKCAKTAKEDQGRSEEEFSRGGTAAQRKRMNSMHRCSSTVRRESLLIFLFPLESPPDLRRGVVAKNVSHGDTATQRRV
jgi:hypothetical protein